MSEILKKPYEISVWENRLVTTDDDSYLEEVKLAVIGSDTMTAPNRVYSPILDVKNNGEQTLTFSLKYKYYDEEVGDFVVNPFTSFLFNERKVKLFYKDKWYEFIIKDFQESQEEYEYTYMAVDAFVNELSKNGYGLTFNVELNNNQGTAVELGKKVVEHTDWVIDEENSDLLRQTIDEAIYEATISSTIVPSQINIVNLDTNEDKIVFEAGTKIYVFYSYINDDSKQTNLQFIQQADKYQVDDNNVITSTNYRIEGDITITDTEIKVGNVTFCTIGDLDLTYKAYRVVYNSLTTYDPVMGRTVDRYEINYDNDKQDVYHYTTTDYTTSTAVTNIVTNGSNFTAYSNSLPTGWVAPVNTASKLYLDTYPSLKGKDGFADLTEMDNLTGYLVYDAIEMAPQSTLYWKRTAFNDGIMNNASLIDSISKGEEYLLRIKYKVYDKNTEKLRVATADDGYLVALIGRYKIVDGVRQIDKESDYYFKFRTELTGKETNNVVRGGELNSDKTLYLINNVMEEPSFKKVYEVTENNQKKQYIWNGSKYIAKTSSNFASYKLYKDAARHAIPNSVLSNPSERIGIFLYARGTQDAEVTFYIEDVQITKYIEDADGNIVFIGDAPSAKMETRDNFYLKPADGLTASDINTYTSIESLATDLAISPEDIVPVQSKGEKVLSISEDKSNCFNILQTICETFECWLKIEVEHDKNGYITKDENGHQIKKLAFKEYVGKDNFAGFKYGINLSSISRTTNTDEIVTKLIVADNSSDYVDSGVVSISRAPDNPNRDSYILNFDYYLKHKLIENEEGFKKDLNAFNQDIKELNVAYQEKNEELIKLSSAYENLKAALNIYSSAYEEAIDEYKEALANFKEITGMSYTKFKESGQEATESIWEAVNKIYAYSVAKNNYGSILSSVKKEYKEIDLKYNGAREYGITITTNTNSPQTKLTIDDYVDGVKFALIDADGIVHDFESSPNQKQFIVEDINCLTVTVTKIPMNYRIQCTINGETFVVRVKEKYSFNIYDTVNNQGKTIRLKLIPTQTHASKYKGIKKELEDILEEKKVREREFFTKYGNYIQEGTWESNDYLDSNLYYIDALQVSKTSAQPKVEYTINVMEISGIEGFENYNFDIGDKTYIEDTDFFGWYDYIEKIEEENPEDPDNPIISYVRIPTPVKEEVIISEIEWHLDEPELNIITIQNYKTQFEDLFQRISATTQSVQYNQASYSRAASILDDYGNINSTLLLNSLNSVAPQTYDMTAGGTIKATENGLVIRNLTSPQNLLIIDSRGINYSNDGGVSKNLLVSPEGVNTNKLTSGRINTQNIIIGDENSPNFRWDSEGLNAYGQNEEGFDLQSFVRFDKYGIYGVQNEPNYIVSSLDDVKDKASFGLTWDGFFIKNKYRDGYVSISSTDDIQVVENDVERIKIGHFEDTDDYGIRIKNSEGQTVFETDDNGDLTVTGTINATAGSFSGSISAAEGQIGGFTIGENALYRGDFGSPGAIYLSTGYESEIPIAGFRSRNQWTIAVGDNFGVDSDGTLYATSAQIRGTIYAESGEFTGHVNATSGNFTGNIVVGQLHDKYITIDAQRPQPIIASSDYVHNTSAGWMINGEGDAIFNNVSVRGAIKTAVFEYSEIQAVGGAFLFRPSSTIKTARIEGNDLVVTTEKTLLFNQNEWVKVSNINDEARIDDNLTDGGLTHVYKIKNNPKTDKFIVLDGAAAHFSSVEPWEDTDIAKSIDGTVEEIHSDNPESLEYIYEYEPNGVTYEATLDMTLIPNRTYYFNYDYSRYVKDSYEANWTEYIYPDDGDTGDDVDEMVAEDVDTEPIEVERSVIYVGNLAIINPEANSTEENFVIVTETVEGITSTKIYSSAPGTFFFKVYLVEESTLKTNVADLEGGALISFGYHDDDSVYQGGIHNYGIGINSSDNYVNLPERAISLFETKIHPDQSVKVTYDYKGILGTLPPLGTDLVNNSIYNNNMAGTQGIFTNNMYIGDKRNFIAYYYDKNTSEYRLIINADTIYEGYDDDDQPIPITPGQDGKDGKDGEDAINVVIESSTGNLFYKQGISSTLTCTVYSGSTDITNQVTKFTWKKKNSDGTIDTNWSRIQGGRSISIGPNDVDSKAIFICEVEF